MDDRQTQIREGAGLEESRLNTEFIDFIRRWSPWVLIVFAALAGVYALNQRLEQRARARVNEAFLELEAASALGSPTPESLEDIAETYSDVRGVPLVARLRMAEIYLDAVTAGAKVGSPIGPDGSIENAEDVLTPEDREAYLGDAEREYQRVYDIAAKDPAQAVHAIKALFGLAAVAECRGDLEGAGGYLDSVIEIGEKTEFELMADIARSRKESLGGLAQVPTLPRAQDLPKPPRRELPPPPEQGPPADDGAVVPAPDAAQSGDDGAAPSEEEVPAPEEPDPGAESPGDDPGR